MPQFEQCSTSSPWSQRCTLRQRCSMLSMLASPIARPGRTPDTAAGDCDHGRGTADSNNAMNACFYLHTLPHGPARLVRDGATLCSLQHTIDLICCFGNCSCHHRLCIIRDHRVLHTDREAAVQKPLVDHTLELVHKASGGCRTQVVHERVDEAEGRRAKDVLSEYTAQQRALPPHSKSKNRNYHQVQCSTAQVPTEGRDVPDRLTPDRRQGSTRL